jgi:hypothetical protein
MKGLAFTCQRCCDVIAEACEEPDVELRRRVDAGQLHTFHKCPHDGGTGICCLVGTTAPSPESTAARVKGE